LVVDDVDEVREVVCEILRAAGFAVEAAANGSEGLDWLARDRFDLALIDIGMPEMNGLEMLARLREVHAAPRVLVMTADDTPQTLLRAVRFHAYRCITKPFDPETLVTRVREALEAPPSLPPVEVVSATHQWVELLVPCAIEVAERIDEFLAHLKADLPEDVRESVGKAFRELLLNAIEWGGRLDPQQRVRIACLRTPRILLYRIADPGPGFRFEGLTHAALSNPPDHPSDHLREREAKGLRPGGFGLLMARAMVDELLYNEAQNEVVLIKYLQESSASSPST
jgi:DNA-binding response OmpR family regulator